MIRNIGLGQDSEIDLRFDQAKLFSISQNNNNSHNFDGKKEFRTMQNSTQKKLEHYPNAEDSMKNFLLLIIIATSNFKNGKILTISDWGRK